MHFSRQPFINIYSGVETLSWQSFLTSYSVKGRACASAVNSYSSPGNSSLGTVGHLFWVALNGRAAPAICARVALPHYTGNTTQAVSCLQSCLISPSQSLEGISIQLRKEKERWAKGNPGYRGRKEPGEKNPRPFPLYLPSVPFLFMGSSRLLLLIGLLWENFYGGIW